MKSHVTFTIHTCACNTAEQKLKGDCYHSRYTTVLTKFSMCNNCSRNACPHYEPHCAAHFNGHCWNMPSAISSFSFHSGLLATKEPSINCNTRDIIHTWWTFFIPLMCEVTHFKHPILPSSLRNRPTLWPIRCIWGTALHFPFFIQFLSNSKPAIT